jgi:hypothetical protein
VGVTGVIPWRIARNVQFGFPRYGVEFEREYLFESEHHAKRYRRYAAIVRRWSHSMG